MLGHAARESHRQEETAQQEIGVFVKLTPMNLRL
jgi:hypothetical protein